MRVPTCFKIHREALNLLNYTVLLVAPYYTVLSRLHDVSIHNYKAPVDLKCFENHSILLRFNAIYFVL